MKKPRRPTDPNVLVPRTTVLALDPERLHAQAEASVRALLKEGESQNTQRSYAGALRYWAAWFRLRYRQPLTLPVPTPAVLQFLIDHLERTSEAGELVHDLPPSIDEALVEGGFKAERGAPALNTVQHRLHVLTTAHKLREFSSPTRDPAVQELMHRARRAYAARGDHAQPKSALTAHPLKAMLATCSDGLIGVRDRALLLFGFSSGGRRRSEIAAAMIENLTRIDADTYSYRLTHSKTRQTGTETDPNADKPLTGEAARALIEWIEAAGIVSGALFRRIRRSKAVEPLGPQAVWRIVRRRAQLAGLESSSFGAHSLRSGFVTEAGRQDVPMREAMAMTDHRSIGTFLKYFQPGALAKTRAANLLAEPDPPESGETDG